MWSSCRFLRVSGNEQWYKCVDHFVTEPSDILMSSNLWPWYWLAAMTDGERWFTIICFGQECTAQNDNIIHGTIHKSNWISAEIPSSTAPAPSQWAPLWVNTNMFSFNNSANIPVSCSWTIPLVIALEICPRNTLHRWQIRVLNISAFPSHGPLYNGNPDPWRLQCLWPHCWSIHDRSVFIFLSCLDWLGVNQ